MTGAAKRAQWAALSLQAAAEYLQEARGAGAALDGQADAVIAEAQPVAELAATIRGVHIPERRVRDRL